jgi:chemotaxis protein CheD
LLIIQDSNQALEAYEYYLKPGFLYLTREATVIYTVLGSCVAVCLWDRHNRIGAMNHFLYPRVAEPSQATTRYGNVAVLTLIRLMLAEGGGRKSLESQIFGGGTQGTSRPEEDIGPQNVQVARKILQQQGIPITSEDVGGGKGRKLIYNTGTNEAVVLKVDRLREEDWYPYQLKGSD